VVHFIDAENEGKPGIIVVVTDDHAHHIKRHLPYLWRPMVFGHIVQHIMSWYKQRREGLPVISVDDIVNRRRKR
jgi:hypothetical protein